MVTWAMVACGKCAPQDTGCVSCMCLAAQHGTRVLKVVNCHKTPCKPVCQWLNAYWLGLSQGSCRHAIVLKAAHSIAQAGIWLPTLQFECICSDWDAYCSYTCFAGSFAVLCACDPLLLPLCIRHHPLLVLGFANGRARCAGADAPGTPCALNRGRGIAAVCKVPDDGAADAPTMCAQVCLCATLHISHMCHQVSQTCHIVCNS